MCHQLDALETQSQRMHRELGIVAVFGDKLGPIDGVCALALELHLLRNEIAEEPLSGLLADECFAHRDELGAHLRLAEVQGQPQEKDHAWIALCRKAAELAQAVHCQVKITWLTAHTFRLVTVDVMVTWRQSADTLRRLDKYSHFIAVILAFYCGAVRRGADNTAEDFIFEGDFTLGHSPALPVK